MKYKTLLSLAVPLAVLLNACTNEEEHSPESESGSIEMEVLHSLNGNPLITNEFIYTNAAGNPYMVTEVQWFISELRLIRKNGDMLHIEDEEGIYYVDTDLAETLNINPADGIPTGTYKGISFTLGFNESQNISNRFVNPPESFMFWPLYLGGGYHYLKLNGKWENDKGQFPSFNFHLGIGQLYDSTAKKSQMLDLAECCAPLHCEGYDPPDDYKLLPITEFIHNHMELVLDDVEFEVVAENTTQLILEMKIENWFQNPHIYDHNHWGGSIMQNQQAMKLGCENVHDVFELKLRRR